jgi:hypothetical protein
MFKLITIGMISSAMLTLASVSAEANIVCRGGFQVSGGQEIATPYCADAALAAAARKDGDKVSDSAIRNNPEVKNSVCKWLGNSPAANGDCPDYDGGDE